jgi:SpoVK/Ycf46/Vps4 family AAA+-type ATPase
MSGTTTTEKKEFKNVIVVREGDKIILPDGMEYPEARKWIERAEVAEETVVEISDTIPCFPLDGIVALSRAFTEKYGFTDVTAKTGWWGMKEPPTMIQVQCADGSFETAPLSRIAPPKWEGGYLEPYLFGPQLNVSGKVKRKFESEVKGIISLTRKMLKERSIYKGQAIKVDLKWWDEEKKKFDAVSDAPTFMETAGAEIILNRSTEFDLETSIYMLAEQSEACKANGISLKHGALLKGPYGTGKTLTSKIMAKKGTDNGWTFIYLRHADQLSNGLKLAKMYAPSIVFAEDVDTVVGKRDKDMNELLNLLDGVDTKDAPIMVILTTNSAETIDPSFLRAGRIDTVVDFGYPEPETAMRFVQMYGGKCISSTADMKQVGEALKGLVPAFLKEAVQKAKRAAIFRTGKSDIVNEISTQELLDAAQSVRNHIKMMDPKGKTTEQMVVDALHTVHYYGDHRELPAIAVEEDGVGK